jgi:hypothetical protein
MRAYREELHLLEELAQVDPGDTQTNDLVDHARGELAALETGQTVP